MPTRSAIRRIGNGAIDMGYYKRRAHALRSRFMCVWLRNLVCRMVRCWRPRTTEVELNALEEHALHDIGISRSDIPAIASGIYFRDESRRQRTRGKTTMTSLDTQRSRQFAERWIEAWNRHDLDAVLAHFSDDFEFSSPFIHQFAGEASSRLVGKEAVRAYWQTGLSRLPDLHFELVNVLAGIECLVILYRGHRGLSAEVFEFDANGQVRRGQALYAG